MHAPHDQPILHHLLHGQGPEQVLVLHDWNGDHRTYDAMRPWLDGDAFTYAFVDLRGHGGSRHMPGRYTVDEIAADAVRVADALGWQRFHLLGHSMTGMATQRIAANVPDRLRSAVAACPISAAGSKLDAASLAFFASTIESDESLRRLLKFVSGSLSPRWVEAKLAQCRESATPESRRGYLAMFTGTDFSAEVQGLATPYLVIVGSHDPGIDEAAMNKTFLAWHPNAELLQVPNCGHYPMQECPPFFATAIEAFFRRHAATPH